MPPTGVETTSALAGVFGAHARVVTTVRVARDTAPQARVGLARRLAQPRGLFVGVAEGEQLRLAVGRAVERDPDRVARAGSRPG